MIKIEENYFIKDRHTFRMPVYTKWFVEYETVEELVTLLQSDLLREHTFFPIGGGSNLLFVKEMYNGVLLHSAIQGMAVSEETDTEVLVEIGAGVVWDDFVAWTVSNGWGGAENLSYIPGEVGASAIQNIGAYGVEVKDIIHEVKAVDVETCESRTFRNAECRYGYRSSVFKHDWKGRYIVTSVVYRLQKSPELHLDYGNLRASLPGDDISIADVRKAVIEIRRSKLPEPDEYGSAGSFFMNPVISTEQYEKLKSSYPDMPHYVVDDMHVKVPAGWLIDRCGWKGKSFGGAAVYEKQCLVLINKNNAKPNDVVLSAEVAEASEVSAEGVSAVAGPVEAGKTINTDNANTGQYHMFTPQSRRGERHGIFVYQILQAFGTMGGFFPEQHSPVGRSGTGLFYPFMGKKDPNLTTSNHL